MKNIFSATMWKYDIGPLDIRAHVPLDDTVDAATPSNHTSEPVVVSQPVSNATGSPPSTAETR